MRWLPILLCLLPGFASAATLELVYGVTRAGQEIGETQERYSVAGERYRIESIALPTGIVAILAPGHFKRISEGEINANGFRPLRYEYHRSARPDKSVISRFDWEGRRFVATYDGQDHVAELPAGTQDWLSALYQLRHWPRELAEQTLSISSNGKSIRQHRYRRAGEETLTTPAGSFSTVKYVRERSAEDDGIQVWVSEMLPAPIKIVLEEKRGGVSEQVLLRYQRGP